MATSLGFSSVVRNELVCEEISAVGSTEAEESPSLTCESRLRRHSVCCSNL